MRDVAFDVMATKDTTHERRGFRSTRPMRLGLELLAVAVLGPLGAWALAWWSTGDTGMVDVDASQVAVVHDSVRGTTRTLAQPGYCLFVPWMEEVLLLDRSPAAFRMEGTSSAWLDLGPELRVRARDGSNFWFDRIQIDYQLVPGQAADVIAASGTGDAFKRSWVELYARAVLRDEFGRFTAEEAADARMAEEARDAARVLLNEALAPVGIRVTQISSPTPKFDRDYEKVIAQRKIAEGEASRLKTDAEKLRTLREQRLAAVRKEKDIEREKLLGTIVSQRLEAEEKEISVRSKAESYARQREMEARARVAQLEAAADTRRRETELAGADLEGRLAILRELGPDADVIVREALVDTLAAVRFQLLPYDLDDDPHEDEEEEAKP